MAEIFEDRVSADVATKLKKVGVDAYERHIFLCCGRFCMGAKEEQTEAWDYLKKRLGELQLSPGKIYRTKCSCLRVCREGPVGLVYPEGTWYRKLNIENIDRVIESHLIGGKVVEDLLIAQNELESKD